MLFGEVIDHCQSHFFPVGSGEFFYGAAVIGCAQALLRINADAGLFFHNITSISSYAVLPVFTTGNACAKMILMTERKGIYGKFTDGVSGGRPYGHDGGHWCHSASGKAGG